MVAIIGPHSSSSSLIHLAKIPWNLLVGCSSHTEDKHTHIFTNKRPYKSPPMFRGTVYINVSLFQGVLSRTRAGHRITTELVSSFTKGRVRMEVLLISVGMSVNRIR